MKTTLRYFTSFAAAAVLFTVIGCNTVSTTRTQAVGGPKFPPSDPAQVQILHAEPTRPHVRLGEVRAEPSSVDVDVTKIEAALRKEASKLGADAVVLVYDKTQTVGAVVTGPWFGRSVSPIEGRVVIAVAIKYQ
jgi:hypothetical protein